MAMKGGYYYYSKATTGAKNVIAGATPLILDVVARMDPADDGSPFTMTDMGCADDGTSMAMVSRVLAEVRRRCPSRPIQMVYTDLPRNDFGQVFRNVYGLSNLEGYADAIPDLYVLASRPASMPRSCRRAP